MVIIKGIIGNEEKEVSLASVIEQVQNDLAKSPQDKIHVKIDSVGGDLDVGFSIYNYLLNLPNQVVTECVNNCASAASVVFLAGDVRIAGCPIMIHNPYIDLKDVNADKDMLQSLAEWIGDKEKEAEKVYSERTKLDSETLSSLMDDETYITPKQAISFGFATQAKIIAVAKLNNSNTNKNSKEMSKPKKSIREYFGLNPKAKAMELTTADGSTLSIKREEGEPQIGDEASPDGTHTMPDGSVIVVVDGKITEITSTSNEEVNLSEEEVEEVVTFIEEVVQENEDLKKENEDLKEQIASAKAIAKSDEDVAMLNAIMKAGGKEWLSKQCSHYKPQARTGGKGKNEVQKTESKISAKLAAVKEKRGIN